MAKLDFGYCPCCSCKMIETNYNIGFLSSMGCIQCKTCDMSYSYLSGYQTYSKSVADKCRIKGYIVSEQREESDRFSYNICE